MPAMTAYEALMLRLQIALAKVEAAKTQAEHHRATLVLDAEIERAERFADAHGGG